MTKRHYLLRGTLLLTITGLLAKFAGFYYKIFLSRTIGAEQIGLFQLTVPVYFFCLSFCVSGMQLAISRYTAQYAAQERHKEESVILFSGLTVSILFSVLCMFLLWFGAPWLSEHFLLEKRCMPLLRLSSFSLPFACGHACISGYFIGKKQIRLSAASQLIEQLVRIAVVMAIYVSVPVRTQYPPAVLVTFGLLAGEFAAFLFSVLAFKISTKPIPVHTSATDFPNKTTFIRFQAIMLLQMAVPISFTRMLLSVFQAIESALLPLQLQLWGAAPKEALSIYGILTGMVLPLILFPTAATGALSSLLLPSVSEARTLNQEKQITHTIYTVFEGSLMLGFYFLSVFLLFGRSAGSFLFHNTLSGIFITRLAFICPFLYLNTTLGSILHGIGKSGFLASVNIAACILRLIMIFLLVPKTGIEGYIASSVTAQIVITCCTLIILHKETGFSTDLTLHIFLPAALCILFSIPILFLQIKAPDFFTGTITGTLILFFAYTLATGTAVLHVLLPRQYFRG